MLKVSDRLSPHGQSTSLINSITIVLLFLAQPISTAKDDSDETDEVTSEEYDSEYDEDKARIDIRPIRDSRTKNVTISTYPSSVSGDGYTLPTNTESPKTTVQPSEFATEDEEVYTGTFKNVHNRDDYNYSGFTLPTIVGTLFTVNIDEWKRAKFAPTSPRPPKLIDPNMMKYFSPRPNYTYEVEYRRFVNWANKKSRADQLSSTTQAWTTKARDTFTLYPEESAKDSDFQQYMAKNWGNASAYLNYRASKKNVSEAPHQKPKSWLDRIALREFRSLPWRNKNSSSRPWNRRPPYWASGDNETRMDDYPPRSGRRRPSYYWTVENNQTVMREIGPEPWRRRRPYYFEGNETKLGGNETGPFEFRRGPWRERFRHPGPWMDRPGPRRYGPPMDMDSVEYERRFNRSRDFGDEPWPEERQFEGRGPPQWDDRDFIPPPPPPPPLPYPPPPPPPPRGPEFEPRDYVDEPPLGYSREFEPRYESREMDRGDYPPVDNRSFSREHYDERIPPPRERDSYDQRAEFDKPPRGRGHDGGRPEFDERRPSRGREQFDDRHSREKDFDARESQKRRQDFEDRPSRDYDRKEVQRGRQDFDDRRSKDKDFDDRDSQRGRQEFDDRRSKDKDFDDRDSQRGRQEFDDRRSKDKDFDDRDSQRGRQEFDDRRSRDRDYRSRKPQRGRQEFSIKDSTNRSSLEERDSKSHSRPYERRDYQRDRDTRGSTREYSSYRKSDRYQSISRADRDFYDRKKETTLGIGSTRDQFAEHAKLYRLRIEQRREKELQKLEKKRKRFWKPTDSGETTTEEMETTTTIITTTRRSYAKGKKKKLAEGEEAPPAGYWFEDKEEQIDDQDPYANVTHPYDEKYMREYQEAKENVTVYTDKYDWITTADPNKSTIRLGVRASSTSGGRPGTGTGEDTQSSPEGKARKGFLKDKGNRPPPRPKKMMKTKSKGSNKGGSKKKKG